MYLWQTARKALGSRGMALLIVGSAGGLTLSFVDVGLTLLLQALLHKMGLQETPASHDPPLALGQNLSTSLLAFALVAVGLARSAGLFLIRYSATSAQHLTISRLRLIRFHHSVHNQATAPFSPAAIQHAHHETYPKTAAYFFSLAQGLGIFIYVVCLLGALAINAPWPTLGATLGLLFLGPVLAGVHRQIRLSATAVPKAHEALMHNIDRLSQNWLYLRLMRLMKPESERLTRHTLVFHRNSLRISFWQLLANSSVSVAGVVLLVSLLFVGVALNGLGGVRSVAFVYLFIRFVQALATLLNSWGGLLANRPQLLRCWEELRDIPDEEIQKAVAALRSKPEVDEPSPQEGAVPPIIPRDAQPPRIQIEALSFGYSQSHPPLFNNISLEIAPGQFCAFVGSSGSGKTTMIALLAGLLEPWSGTVLIDGDTPGTFYENKMTRVGFVGSTPYLVAGSLRENLSLGISPPPSDSAILQAVRAVMLEDRIALSPDGLDQHLLPGGDGFSAGEKQRLCLARALLSRPQILFLDEISANLDQETERAVTQSLAPLKGRCTIIIATHRTAMLSLADQVLCLPEGTGQAPHQRQA